ncbi:MAG: electron transport complex, RnfABCDGE type, G subunit [Gammaproteobacteria bacterium]|nr:electron transport complex, RnfABCDGE type, G subunit [Gammaproteobacteria bacterium]
MNERVSNALPALLPLLFLAVICAGILMMAGSLSRDRIESNRRTAQLRLIAEVMYLPYDNDLLSDRLQISDRDYFAAGTPVGVYRAHKDGQPIGLVFMPVMASGYNGLIELAVGVTYNGELTGVRVHQHRETAGLGDQIHQNRSSWISGFDQRSLANTPVAAWGVSSDGGDFDQISGATISPRGVIKAVRNTLDYYAIHKNELYK